jgi:hypothetical protein
MVATVSTRRNKKTEAEKTRRGCSTIPSRISDLNELLAKKGFLASY